MTIADRVKAVVVDQLGVDDEEVTLTADINDDLGADSLDRIEMMMALEEEFNIEIHDSEAEPVRTVGQAIALVEAKLDCGARARD